jgi:hypothetical protein
MSRTGSAIVVGAVVPLNEHGVLEGLAMQTGCLARRDRQGQ